MITTRTTFASNQHVLIKLLIHCFCSFIPFSCTSMIIYMILLTSMFSEVRGNTDITQIQPSTARHTHTRTQSLLCLVTFHSKIYVAHTQNSWLMRIQPDYHTENIYLTFLYSLVTKNSSVCFNSLLNV